MAADKAKRLSKIARELNVGLSTIIDFLEKKGVEINANPNTKVSADVYEMLVEEYASERLVKKESENLDLGKARAKKETVSLEEDELVEGEEEAKSEEVVEEEVFEPEDSKAEVKVKVVGKIELEKKEEEVEEEPEAEEEEPVEEVVEVEEKLEEVAEVEEEPVEEEVVAETEEEEVVEEETAEPEQQEEAVEEEVEDEKSKVENNVKVVGKIDLDSINQLTRPPKKTKKQKEEERKERELQKQKDKEKQIAAKKDKQKEDTDKKKDKVYRSGVEKLSGPRVVGKIDIKKGEQQEADGDDTPKKKRKRIKKDKVNVNEELDTKTKKPVAKKVKGKKRYQKPEVSEEDVQKQIKDTLARLTTKTKSKGAKYRREKRDAIQQKQIEEQEKQIAEQNVIKVTEFVTANELASMMSVAINDIISTCMSLGMFISINQRLDAETISLLAEEFNYKVEFVSVDVQESIEAETEPEEELEVRSPIVTVMGHVDHGKTSLLDHIRKANVIAGEAGGITQHIGAYNVELESGKKITFLDTPGHEAFTAMRARGAQVTDVAIIVVAADDNVMPQTVEAINHASAAGVPIVFAINKIDKPGANPEKIKEELANMNYLVEDWGGKYQSQEISAKHGKNIEELLEKVLLEAELLDLKANPTKKANGTIIESSLDKGRGFIATILVEGGTLRTGDIVLAGSFFGHVKAMFNERGVRVDEAGPATPVLILGLNGAPQAGDKFNVMESDREAKEFANKREQLQREQGMRTQKHITLDEIGRRIAIGNFQELNVIVKGDVDGSIEALSDSLLKLSTEEIQVNVIHKAVGQITESDVLLAMTSNAIIVGFQVRPSIGARKLAEKEEIDIRLYSIIYDAINEIKDAMEGMLSPEIKEEILGTAEIREVFKISKVGTIAGCYVKEGKIFRNAKVRVIREGIVVYTGDLGSLKRFKDDVREVAHGYECGLNVEKYNDIKVGDLIEAFKEVEVKRTLE